MQSREWGLFARNNWIGNIAMYAHTLIFNNLIGWTSTLM